MPWWPWKDATERLGVMVRQAERALADPNSGFRFRIVPRAAAPSPIIVAAGMPSILLGPDGKPIKEAS